MIRAQYFLSSIQCSLIHQFSVFDSAVFGINITNDKKDLESLWMIRAKYFLLSHQYLFRQLLRLW